MTIAIDPSIEARFRARAQAAGISVDAYIERLANAKDGTGRAGNWLSKASIPANLSSPDPSTGRKNIAGLTRD
jgi:hypothetical protein